MSDLKQDFIIKALTAYHEKQISTMRIVFKRAGIRVTNEGLNSLAYKVVKDGGGAQSKLTFKEYLRMVDMGAGRGHPLGGLKNTLVQLQSNNTRGLAQIKDMTRKPKTFIYSKIAYGLLTGLQNDLLYGYTNEAIEEIKKAIQNKAV